MDQQTLQKLARLRILAAKEGKAFDLVKFVSDRVYAKDTLTAVLASEQEETLLLGMDVMSLFGLMPAQPVAGPEEKKEEERYVRSLR